MKSQKIKSLATFILVLLLGSSIGSEKKMKKTHAKEKRFLDSDRNELNDLWGELFSEKRGIDCKTGGLKNNNQIANIAGNKEEKTENALHSMKADDSWVKQWGYGESAYLFDYLDTVFQKQIVEAFKKVYFDAQKVSGRDTEKYKDVFDIKKILAGKKNKNVDFKTINKNFRQEVYDVAINSVQLNQVMKLWNWFVTPGDSDYAVSFIKKFDLDGDGRVNPRELILGDIIANKDSMGSGCSNCFSDIGFKLDAMFFYLDCDSDGFINAEDLWNKLPNLSRPDSHKHNIFSQRNSENIRTSAVNDFILKNSVSTDGYLTKDEFRTGVLLGYWDRQTRETGIVEDDSRNLKKLRWSEDGKTDTVAFNYMKQSTINNLIKKS